MRRYRRDGLEMNWLHWLCDQLSDDPGKDTAAHYLVLYSLARFLPAKVAVEIGTDDGSTTVPLLLGCVAAGGVLHSVDPAQCDPAHATVFATAQSSKWRFHRMTSEAFAPECPDGVDLVFIDGDHSYEGVALDWRLYSPKVRVGGLVVLHDACNTADFPGIAQLIEEEIRPRTDWGVAQLNYGYGLTICERRA